MIKLLYSNPVNPVIMAKTTFGVFRKLAEAPTLHQLGDRFESL